MRFMFRVVVLLLAAAAGVHGQQVSPLTAPDTIYHNGKIITVDRPFTIAEAFAVKGDRFVAAGRNAEIRGLAGPETRLVDLRGHSVIPGIIDNHNHQIWRARVLHRGIDMINVPSLAEMLNRIRQAAVRARPGEVIVASGGWSPRTLPEQRGPTRRELDEAAPRNPVFVFQSSRNNVNLNSASLRILGIDRNTKDWGSFPVLRDDAGEPTGVMSGGEQALAADWKLVPQPTVEQQIEWLVKEQQDQHALGLTMIRELTLPVEHMRVYLEMHRQGKLSMRVSLGLLFGVQHVDGSAPVQMDQMLSQWPMLPGLGNDMVQFDGTLAEFEVDTQRVGNMMRQPFLRPNNRRYVGEEIGRWPHSDFLQVLTDEQGNYYGVQRLPTDLFREVVLKMNRYGWRPGFHISGDRGLDMNLEAYEAADREKSIRDKRWVVEHIQYSHPNQMERLARLNILVSTQQQGMNAPNSNFSKELNERVQPIREWLDHGLIVSSGSDWPAFSNNPFPYLQFYVTRITNSGAVVGEAQKITREEALRLATINNAYMLFRERDLGSIEAGKLADFVILSEDFLTVPEQQIKTIHPLATYVGGNKVYADSGGGF